MPYSNSIKSLSKIFEASINSNSKNWLKTRLNETIKECSTKKLYLTYTLCSSNIEQGDIDFNENSDDEIENYLKSKKANTLELARIFLLVKVLEANDTFFKDKVINLIQVADISELVTFLNYLVLLPNAENFKFVGVEALRTNIATVFDAIAMDNPYPSLYFNEQQWNQMYLKAAFMQRDLSKILGIDIRANKELARIISDYAHERWAASRDIDPQFWRPVSNYIQGQLLSDIERLFKSDNHLENKAAALVCFKSKDEKIQQMLVDYPKFEKQLKNGILTWDDLRN